MKVKMTIDEALEFADEWSAGQTFHEDSQGWRVVCMLLAKEVRGSRVVWIGAAGIRLDGMEPIDGLGTRYRAQSWNLSF